MIDLTAIPITLMQGFIAMGDINNDENFNVLDIVSMVSLVLDGNCPDAGDMNDDGSCNVLDIVSLVNCILMQNCEGDIG